MAGRRTNLALLGLLVVAFATGVVAFGIGTVWNVWATVAHAVAGIAIVVVAPWKQVVVRRGLARRRRGYRSSIALYALIAISLASGIAHSTGLLWSLGPVSAMQLHVGSALVAIPFAIAHLALRPAPLRRADLGRRQMLKMGALAGGSAALYGVTEGLLSVASLPGRSRRYTGSFETGSGNPQEMPVTQWLDDKVLSVDVAEWRLEIVIEGEARTWSYEELSDFDDGVTATLDCTGGWYATQEWEGVWLGRLLGAVSARSVAIASATGYGRRFPSADRDHLLLATRVGGRQLSDGHGFPLRLVAPGRRGFWWVKWVNRIETSDVPWWAQTPFPLT